MAAVPGVEPRSLRVVTESDSIPGFRDRIALLVGKDDPFTWAKKVGIPSSTFDRIWNSGSTPKARHLIRIADTCAVSIDWLLTGQAPHGDAEALSLPGLFPMPSLQALPDASGARMAMTVASGDGMEPTIRDGDILFVDISVTAFVDDAIYLIANGASFVVKRVQHLLNGTVLIKADNPAYASETLPSETAASLRCIGRVRWIGRAG